MKTVFKENEIKKCIVTSNSNKLETNTASINIHELPTSYTQQKCQQTNLSNKVSDDAIFGKSSFHNHAQPYPFTFLTAVKCKLPVDKSYALQNTAVKTNKAKNINEYSMDPVEPLNLPNFKISSKICHDSANIGSSQEKLLTSKKTDIKNEIKQTNSNEISTYSKFPSSAITTTLKSKNFGSLKAPKLELSKEKVPFKTSASEKDDSRGKENKFKKIKKEDINTIKNRYDGSNIVRCSRNHKYTSKTDILDKVTNKIIKKDNILNREFKDNSNVDRKLARTIRENIHKSSKLSTRPCKEVKSNTCSKVNSIVDEDHQSTNSDVDNCISIDNSQVSNVLLQKSDILQNSNVKTTFSENQSNSNSIESVEMMSQDYREHFNKQSTKFDKVMASVEKYQKQALVAPLLGLSIPKQDSQQNNSIQHDCSVVLSANDSNQSLSNSIIETRLSQDSLSAKLLDPLRISFRDDSYSNQPEFNDLVTPDVNLTIRSKRRKQIVQYADSDDDHKDSKLSRKDQSLTQGIEVRSKTESNSPDQLVGTQKTTHFIEGSAQDNASSSNTWGNMSNITTESKFINTDNNEIETKNSSIKEMMGKPSSQTHDTVIQTETISCQYRGDSSLVLSKEYTDPKETLHISLGSESGDDDVTRMDDIRLSSKMRAMSEISLHETTSSIRTETGTEISISLRDVTCSFNKNLDLEMAQLIDDERQRYNKIEMLFKSREKTLNDRTRKLVKLEEQKKVLRDTGQDSRISSVKKKQRALLLKLQQEKDEMNRLKELHKIASQERKLMLQKQRDMFNPDMSTKNILHKLKRSADSQSPRRLSGPMKGYDIRSNSSISSLIDSDKSQFDRSKLDCTMNLSDGVLQKENKNNSKLGIDRFPNKTSRSIESHNRSMSKIEAGKYFEEASVSQMKCDLRSKKFDERMPKSDMKYQLYDLESMLGNGTIELLKNDNHISLSRSKDQNFIFENVRSKSNALIEEFTDILKSHFSQSKTSSTVDQPSGATNPNIDNKNTKRRGLKWHKSKTLPANSPNTSDLRYYKKTFCHERKSSEKIDEKEFRNNCDNSRLDELQTNAQQISVQELIKHSDFLKERNKELLKDIVDERENFAKQSSGILLSTTEKDQKNDEEEEEEGEDEKEEEIIEKSDNVSVQSHVSLAISHQSSNESDKSYLKSVVIRSQKDYQPNSSFQTTKKLEEILKAREATLISRRNCVEEWISWHARLRDEEERVSRMEKAAYKLVSATGRTLSLNDTTISSDNSDVEGRIELLTKKLSDRRFEMTRLKKEARKQAKRRLRALEANLLTQIKRYDATISEMRKKLETKKGPNKENTKLEIETKSVDEYVVPNIPIKKIQDIYKNSNLLRPQSDFDVPPMNKNDTRDESSTENSCHAEQIEATKANLPSQDSKSVTTGTDNSARSESQSDIQRSKALDVLSRGLSQNSNISEQISSKVNSSQTENYANGDSTTEDTLTHNSGEGSSSILSKKLSYIQLHNKELNNDIHNLENDLRELSEMMLNFSKKSSDHISMSMDSTKKTSNAVDESFAEDMLHQVESSKLVTKTNTIDTDLQMRVKETLSNGIPDTDDISISIEELYSEIKSKDDQLAQHSSIPESCRKSVGLEQLLIPPSPRAIDEKDDKSDTCSILEIISTTVDKDDEESTIDEINHQTYTSPKLSSKGSNGHLKIKDNNNDISAQSTDVILENNQSEPIDNDLERSLETISKNGINEREEIPLSGQSLNVPSAKETDLLPLVSTGTLVSDNVLSELKESLNDELDDNNQKSLMDIESQIQDEQITKDCNQNSISDVEDSTIFVPKGESTNLHETFVLKLDNSSDIGMGICSEEFNDILEIIERETKNDDRHENGFQETNSGSETKKDDTQLSVGHDNAYNEVSFEEKETKIQETKKPLVDSEQIFENANDDIVSSITNKNTGANSIVKLNEISEHPTPYEKQDNSSEGDQINNLIEVAENKLDIMQKSVVSRDNKIWTDKHKTHVTVFLDKTLQVIKDPEYDDISEESLEVSDIFNGTNQGFHKKSKRIMTVPEKYIIKSESNEVLRILDEISNKPNKLDRDQESIAHKDINNSLLETSSKACGSSNENVSPVPFKELSRPKQYDASEKMSAEFLDNLADEIDPNKSNFIEPDFNSDKFKSSNDNERHNMFESNLDLSQEVGKNARLDIEDISQDNTISSHALLDEKTKNVATEFRTTPMGVSSEQDIETMIKKLKASLEQPGIEVAELEAKLLEIENLQIELAIKKLEAEEVSYYVREIPNKPPPPYTPPGSVRQVGSNGVSPSFAVIPTNIEELTYVTEKATAIIHVKKTSGEDIQVLEAPDEICETFKDLSSDAVKKNRQIYNNFLFDLCKELIVDVYKVEEENPGPSWTKPKVKTKRVIKIPKSINELNEYISKEVATLFGFKTKLQRENMVMRWSRKRRDRVDELLAKEAQAEEKEWTKFHHDELAVKNVLTVTILNNLLMETTSCIQNAYAKKRKLSVL